MRASRLFFGVLLASAASVAMSYAYAGEYDAESVLMSPPTQEIQLAQAEMPPAAIPTRKPYVEEDTDDEAQAVMPDDSVYHPQPSVAAQVDAKPASTQQQSPVDYAAETVDYDQKNKVVTLSGRVELLQEGRKLEADRVVYNLKDDIATAEGHVVITDVNGDVHHAESVELSDKMRKGLVDELFTTMADGSRVWAAKGVKESEQRYKLENASYTACKPCKEDPTKRPPWQLHAKEVELRKDEQRVVYRNAWLDFMGVPVLYTPYFSHPDGSVEQKSGFLTPTFGFNSELGGFYAQPYYWAISPSTDTTFTLMPTTKEGPLLRNEFRKRWENAYIETDASVTHSGRTDSVAGAGVDQDSELRGHFFGNGGWDINDKWRARANLNLTSDEQYLRQYGFSDDYILENEIYAERFENRDYAIIKGMAFQDLRTTKTDQPNILPYAEYSALGDPNGLMGGRWQWDSSILSLARDGNGQDVWRASTRGAWDRRDITSLGVVFDTELAARADGFITTNRIEHAVDPLEDENNTESRFIPSAQLTASYPMKRDFKDFQLRVEPVASVYVAPDVNNDSSLPNEDSQDVQLDAANLFDGNRFPGLDRIEDESHIDYGLKAGLYDYEGGRLSAFLGQSYSLEDNNLFPNGSGLEDQSSDYVGAINASFDEGRHSLSYRFQVDSDTLASQRHELYAQTEWGPVEVDGNYLYAAGAPGTAYANSREQITLGSTIELNDVWSLRGDAIYDLSNIESERGLRRSIMTVNYEHECYNLALTADRYLADASSGVQDTTIMFRIGLKNLGEYETKRFNLSPSSTASDD